MGCLLEIFFELLLELILHGYMKLMQLIVPHKTISENVENTIRNIVKTYSAIFLIVLIIGVILFVQADPYFKNIGRYMTFIPLAIMGLQILLGILAKIIRRFQK